MKKLMHKLVYRAGVAGLLILLLGHAKAQTFAAHNDQFNVLQGACSYYLDVEANDSLGNFGPVTLQISTNAQNGSCTVNGNYITYCPSTSYVGADKFSYRITAGGNTDTASVYVNIETANSFVYPGDADQNGRVENFDLLAVGLTYGLSGPSRQDSSSLNALAWPPSSAINTNPGAADCNGNGLVDLNDANSILSFYNDSVHFGNHFDDDTSICNDGNAFYILSNSGDTIVNGDILYISINLGYANSPSRAYGIAFTLDYDTGFIPANSISFSSSASWLLQNDAGLMLNHAGQGVGKQEVALTKTNHAVANGGGMVLTAAMPIDDNICGLAHAPGWYNLYLGLSKIRIVDENNVVQNVCVVLPDLLVYKSSLTAVGNLQADVVNIYPNPASEKLLIEGTGIEAIDISDLMGRKIYGAVLAPTNKTVLDIDALGIEDGIYTVQVKTLSGITVKKIIIQH